MHPRVGIKHVQQYCVHFGAQRERLHHEQQLSWLQAGKQSDASARECKKEVTMMIIVLKK